jgi:peptide/nickel transport system ATP-binding protein
MQVMYGGRIAERGPVDDVLSAPSHPYTRGLVRLVPRLDQMRHENRLRPIPGTPPVFLGEPDGCRFRDRCELAHDACVAEPPLVAISPERSRACWLPAAEVEAAERTGTGVVSS